MHCQSLAIIYFKIEKVVPVTQASASARGCTKSFREFQPGQLFRLGCSDGLVLTVLQLRQVAMYRRLQMSSGSTEMMSVKGDCLQCSRLCKCNDQTLEKLILIHVIRSIQIREGGR